MKNIYTYLVGIILCFSACNGVQTNPVEDTGDTIVQMPEPSVDGSNRNTVKSSGINELAPGKDTLKIMLELKSNDRVTVPVEVLSGDSIFGIRYSDDRKANIRFTQIALPGEKFDGPFGREIKYRIKTPGRYALIIGENMMAGDPRDEHFTLEAWVK